MGTRWFTDTDSLRYSNHAVTKRIKTDLSVRRVPRVSLSERKVSLSEGRVSLSDTEMSLSGVVYSLN